MELSVPLFEWNLENYSSVMKIAIEEVDFTEKIISTESMTTEFATNFEYSPSFGEKVKVGLKFGSQEKDTHTQSHSMEVTYGNDELGEVVVNFGDDVLISDNDVSPWTNIIIAY